MYPTLYIVFFMGVVCYNKINANKNTKKTIYYVPEILKYGIKNRHCVLKSLHNIINYTRS